MPTSLEEPRCKAWWDWAMAAVASGQKTAQGILNIGPGGACSSFSSADFIAAVRDQADPTFQATSPGLREHVTAVMSGQREPAAQDLPPVYPITTPNPMEPPMASGMTQALLDQADPANSIISRIAGGIAGFVTGGVPGAIGGVLTDPFGSVGGAVGGGSVGGSGSSAPPTSSFVGSTCPPGYYSVGGTCVNPGAALPGGVPLTVPQPGTSLGTGAQPAAAGGAFGIPAYSPDVYSTVRRRCIKGMVLGTDNLCYPKSMIPRKYRKWQRAKPIITRADFKAINRADRARKRLVGLTKKSGAFASMHKPKPTMSKAAAARALRK